MNQNLREAGIALLIALAAVGLVLGALTLSRAEDQGAENPTLAEFTPSSQPVIMITNTQPPTLVSATVTLSYLTITPYITYNLYIVPTSGYRTPTRTYQPRSCNAPAGWDNSYIVNVGDTLYKVALMHYTTVSSLQNANCMGASTVIYPGERLWVPSITTRTPDIEPYPFISTTAYPTDPITETPLPFTATPIESQP